MFLFCGRAIWYDEDTVNFFVESAFSRLNQRPVYAFLLLTVIAGAVSLFLLKKANTAVNEIESIQSVPLFVARKEYLSDDIVGTVNISGWKTYRNEEYGFEIKYPVDFEEYKSSTEFGALESRAYREVFVNIIPPSVNFREYLDALTRIRAKGQRDGRIVIFKKGSKTVSGREGFEEELYDSSINSFVIRTFADFTPHAVVSITVREGGKLDGKTGVSSGLRRVSDGITSTLRRVP